MGKITKHERKKYLIISGYMLDKVLEKTKETIGIDDTKILINKNDTLSDYITLINAEMLINCAIEDEAKFYSQMF